MNETSANTGPFALRLMMCCLLLAGCRTAERDRIFADVRVNDKPVRFAYDTGAEATVIFSRPAKRLGLEVTNAPASAKAATGKVMLGHTGFCRFTVDNETYKLKLATLPLPWFASWVADVDGVIGWPDIKEDFVSIDAVTRTIKGMDKLPEDTNGWLKLPLYPRTRLLAVEIPRADGKTGVMELDTGNDGGISLSRERWKEWRVTHPHAHWNLVINFMPGSGLGIGRAFRADDVSIGPLTWKKVAIGKANRTELGIVSPGDISEGSIGIKAMRQLNIIIDQRDHTAYFRPRPDDKSPQPASASPGSAVHFRFREREQRALAVVKFYSGDFDGALQNIDSLLEIQPDDWGGFNLRGIIHYARQDWDDAIRDFHHAGELAPETVDYGQFYVWIIRARIGQKAAATQDLAAYVGKSNKIKDDPWAVKIAAFLLDRLGEADFLRAVSNDPGNKGEQQCDAWYYAGMKHQLAGDAATARDDFRKCVATGQKGEDEYQFAAAELKILEKSR